MADKLDYEQMANDIVMAVGGPDNIKTVAHCMTRIRFVLKKEADANTTTVKAIPGVLGVVSGGASGEYMVILGQHLLPVFEAVQKKFNLSAGTNTDEDLDTVKKPFTVLRQ